MVNRILIVVGVLMLLCLAACSGLQPRARESSLLLGTGVRTITPPVGVPRVGYPSPRPNTGVGLDLCARAAVFGTPGKSGPEAALVVLDLIHVDADLGRVIRERAAAALPGLSPEAIMVSGTHTHSGPAVSECYAEDTDTGRDAGYIEKVITGAAGNINPRECLFAEPERARPMGEAIAAEVVASLGQTRPLKAAPIAIVSAPFRATVRPEAERRYAARVREFPEGRRIVSEVQVLRLGELAFVSAPGELVAELGLAVQNSSPFAQTIIVYNANDHLGSLVTETIRREGGHEANSAVSLDIEKPFLAAAREALARAAATEK